MDHMHKAHATRRGWEDDLAVLIYVESAAVTIKYVAISTYSMPGTDGVIGDGYTFDGVNVFLGM